MVVKTKPKLTADFNWQIPAVIPSLPEGDGAEALYEAHVEDVVARFGGNNSLTVAKYDSEGKQIIGSNVFLVGQLGELVSSLEMRTAVASDDRNGDISRIVGGKFYIDFNDLIVRSDKDISYTRNNGFLKQVIETVEGKQGKVKFPFMVEGFYVVSNEDGSYGMGIFPASNFRVVEDERLDGKKYRSGMKFDKVDDLGLPVFDKNGTRIWYAKDSGLSRLCLGDDLRSSSGGGDLASSSEDGRVVFVRESLLRPTSASQVGNPGTSQNFADLYKKRNEALKARFEKAQEFLDNGYQRALRSLHS